MKTKYIVIRSEDGEELIFTFMDTIAHFEMFAAVKTIKQGIVNWVRPYFDSECVGAGFVQDGRCYGRSESLDIDSRGNVDTKLLG